MNDTGDRVTVEPFTDDIGSKSNIPVITGAVAYDCPQTNLTYILIFHQALYIESMAHHLLSTFQLNNQGVQTNLTALQHLPAAKRRPTSHSLLVKEAGLHIPFHLNGTMSAFTVRMPTQEEIDDVEQVNCRHVTMTSELPWSPQDPKYSSKEDLLRKHLDRDPLYYSRESKQLSQLQLRGQKLQHSGPAHAVNFRAAASPSDPDKFSLPLSDNDVSFSGASSEGTPPNEKQLERPGSPTCPLMETGLTLAQLQNEARYTAAIDVDRAASTLLEATTPLHEPTPNQHRSIEALAAQLASSSTIRKRRGFVSPAQLAERWGIGLETAKKTVEATTQLAVRDFTHTKGGRRLKPYAWQLHHPRRDTKVYTDTLFAKCTSLRGNKMAQVFFTEDHATHVFPMKERSEAHIALDDFFRRMGVPHTIVPDNAKELTMGDFKRKCQKHSVALEPIEPHTPNQNKAEGSAIKELKRQYRKLKIQRNFPEVIWDDALEWIAQIRSHTALNIAGLDGQVPLTKATGDTRDISHLAEFGLWDWVWYLDPQPAKQESDMMRKKLGKYLGPDYNSGDALTARVLSPNAHRRCRTSVWPLSKEDAANPEIRRLKEDYLETLKATLKERAADIKVGKRVKHSKEYTPEDEDHWLWDDQDDLSKDYIPYEPYSEDELPWAPPKGHHEDKLPLPDLAEADEIDFDKYVSAKVALPRGGHSFGKGVVLKRVRDQEGKLVGHSDSNPLLDTSVYEVQFEDGAVERFTANTIAEHIYSQIDGEGYGQTLLDEIIDHQADSTALTQEQAELEGTARHTTKGWKLLVQFKDKEQRWIKLKDLKESNPVELAEYAAANQLLDQPAFKWWAPFVIRKRNRILSKMQKRYFRTTQKFGIEVPKTVARALEIDKENGNTFWQDAIKKEMGTVMKAFDILPDGAVAPPGFGKIKCHLVFDVKMGSLQRKARFVCDGSRSDVSEIPTYASVVSRDSVRIGFMLAALNGLDMFGADCEGAYLNAPPREKHFVKCGPEFGEYEGRIALIVRALYGTKSAAASWRAMVSGVIQDHLGFQMCRADNDVWFKRGTNSAGMDCYHYIMVYSDDLLVIADDPKEYLRQLEQHFVLKPDSVKPPDQYLGAQIGKYQLEDGSWAWYASSDTYVQTAIANVERWMTKDGQPEALKQGLKSKVACVLPSGYKPELDVSDELDDTHTSWFQQQIGVLRWMVELGRIDITTEVSMLASYCAQPREGHLGAVLHMFGYLKQHPRSKMVFDPAKMDHEPHMFFDWTDQNYGYKEAVPRDMPEPLGLSVQTTCYVDSDHAGDMVSRRSRTGIIIYCNRAPILFHSKKQGSIETSSFGSELSAMKTAVEMVEGLRYKLRMMGVPLDGPTYVKADNMSVIHNCSNPESQLKKKSNSIAYHYVRERCAGPSPVCCITYIPTDENLADMFTKTQPAIVRRRLTQKILY